MTKFTTEARLELAKRFADGYWVDQFEKPIKVEFTVTGLLAFIEAILEQEKAQ